MKNNKQQVLHLLESIETWDTTPISYINPDKYIQHNQWVKDGLAGFGELLSKLPEGGAKVKTMRVFQDGDFVFTHTDYDFFGPKIGFDVFKFEDGKIVEHWDNLQETVTATVSGRTMIDGPTEVTDVDKTEENRELITNMIHDIFLWANPGKITEYFSTQTYNQHNPMVADGLNAFGTALKGLAEAGTPMIFTKNHKILVEWNFAMTITEWEFLWKHVSFYDLFRIENGKIVEHWDTIENIKIDSEALNTNWKFNF